MNLFSKLTALILLAISPCVYSQACGTIYQVPFCREDCGSCAAMPCCTLEWTLPENSAMDFVLKLIASAKRGGPDGLYTLQGHLAKYPEFSTDIYDDSPRNVQANYFAACFFDLLFEEFSGSAWQTDFDYRFESVISSRTSMRAPPL